jgi:hypothetical protein
MGLYTGFAKGMRYRHLVGITSIFNCLLLASNSILYARITNGWTDYLFIIGEDVLGSMMSMLNWMPTFLISSRVCPTNAEATTFSLLCSNSNFSSFVAVTLSATIGRDLFKVNVPNMDGPVSGDVVNKAFEPMWRWNLTNSLINLVPLLFIWLLPRHRQDEEILPEDDRISATIGSPFQRLTGRKDRVTEHYRKSKLPPEPSTDIISS